MVLALLFCVVGPCHGAIIAEIVRVGYPTDRGAVVRSWSWMPVVVDLRLEGEAQFNGYLRLRQFDRDGDAVLDVTPVHLAAGTGGQQRYVLYTVANPVLDRDWDIRVELLRTDDPDDDVGELTRVISGGSERSLLELPVDPLVIPDDDYLVLYVSDRPTGRIRHLADYDRGGRLDRRVSIAHVAPVDLPGQWVGLQMLDAIVWDQADATQLTPQQQQALANWVGQGGQLMLAAARTSDTLKQSDILAPLLPVQFGPVESTVELETVRKQLLGERAAEGGDLRLEQPIAVVRCQALDQPTVRTIAREDALDTTVVASRLVGRGRVVFVAAELSDLMRHVPEPINAFLFYKRTLELRDSSLGDEPTLDVPPYRYLESETAFARSGAVFLTVALLFTVAYVLLSTVGAWRFLKARDLLKHSWTVLALLAGVASVLSIVGVQAFHGVGRRLHQVSIVDGVAGSVDAWGTAYFGVATGTFSALDFWLPQDALLDDQPIASPCFLQPLGRVNPLTRVDVSFTDPARYVLKPSEALLEHVPVRATLKQLEGSWTGALRSTLQASVRVGVRRMPDSADLSDTIEEFVILPGSWIQNAMDVTLRNCQLFVTDRDAFEAGRETNRIAGIGADFYAIPLGDLAAGERMDLFTHLYQDASGATIPRSGSPRARGRKGWKLSTAQKQWASSFQTVEWSSDEHELIQRAVTDTQSAILLMTTHSDLDPLLYKTSFGARPRLTRAHCRALDLTAWLTRTTAVLVGFSDTVGPVRLAARGGGQPYELLQPENNHALTAYRFLIPLQTP